MPGHSAMPARTQADIDAAVAQQAAKQTAIEVVAQPEALAPKPDMPSA